MKKAYTILIKNPKEKILSLRSRRRGEDNIKMDFKEIGSEVVDWIQLDHDRVQWRALMTTAMNLRIP
jgi:hypothetical protein